MSTLSIFILVAMPNTKRLNYHAPLDMRELVKRPILLCNINIFFLHLVLTVIFVIFPFMMMSEFNISTENQWKFYISSLILSLLFSGPLIMSDDRNKKKMSLVYPIAFLLFSQIVLIVGEGSSLLLFSSLLVFLFHLTTWRQHYHLGFQYFQKRNQGCYIRSILQLPIFRCIFWGINWRNSYRII